MPASEQDSSKRSPRQLSRQRRSTDADITHLSQGATAAQDVERGGGEDRARDGAEEDGAENTQDEGQSDDIFTVLNTGDEDADEDAVQSLLPHFTPPDALLPAENTRAPYRLDLPLRLGLEPRAYQREAVDAWLRAAGRGVVVLPTGAGKTVVAFSAIARMGVRALVVVPTIELLRQWRTGLAKHLGVPEAEVGAIGGGEHTTGALTVITYDSAAMPRRKLDGYGLLIFDEAHHLPAQSYRNIVKRCGAPWRLGLSATLERADGRHNDLTALIGPVVYERDSEELSAARHIAAYKERRLFVDLSPDEEVRYETLMGEWRWFLATRRSQLGVGPQMFEAIIRRSGFDPEARRALRAHHEARLVAMNASAKIATIEELLRRHSDEKVLIFSEYVGMVERISQALLIPAITYRTPPVERKAILEGFRSGYFTKLVTGRVLNEGVDVPDASIAIVASGSSSMREYVQRLGRVLRPKPTEATLYELISRRTTERNAARRRRPERKTPTTSANASEREEAR